MAAVLVRGGMMGLKRLTTRRARKVVTPRRRMLTRKRVSTKTTVRSLRERRSARRARKLTVGLPPRMRPISKAIVQLNQDRTNISERTWSAIDLCAIASTTAAGLANVRDGRAVTISGFKHMHNWFNLSNNHVTVYNFWISPKQYKQSSITDAELQAEWFRRDGEAADVDQDWKTDADHISYQQAINKDKFIVLKTAHFKLGPGNEGTIIEKSSMSSVKTQRIWVPLNRKFTYEQQAGDNGGSDLTRTEQAPVFWVSYAIRHALASGGVNSALVSRQSRIVTFFRDGSSM